MQPTVQTNPFRSVLIFVLVGIVLLVAVVAGVRWAKSRSDQYAQASTQPQTVAQQPQQQQNQPAQSQAQTDEQKKAEEEKKAAEQKAAEDKKKADEQKAAEEKKQAEAKAAEEKKKADEAAAKAAADQKAKEEAAKKAAEEQKKVATTGPAPTTVPSTGMDDVFVQVLGAGVLVFLGMRYIQSRRRLMQTR